MRQEHSSPVEIGEQVQRRNGIRCRSNVGRVVSSRMKIDNLSHVDETLPDQYRCVIDEAATALVPPPIFKKDFQLQVNKMAAENLVLNAKSVRFWNSPEATKFFEWHSMRNGAGEVGLLVVYRAVLLKNRPGGFGRIHDER